MSTELCVSLGCGDGRIVIESAKKTSCSAFGVELDAKLYDIAIAHSQRQSLSSSVHFICSDIFEPSLMSPCSPPSPLPTTYWDATAIFVYLLPEALRRLYQEVLLPLMAGRLQTICSFRWPIEEVDQAAVRTAESVTVKWRRDCNIQVEGLYVYRKITSGKPDQTTNH
eukprot:GHVS01048265.1.p1 GENE.GHVS01048265.1~~GHVS01048265.1.p1  ORF type:complete len:168 (+),score=25.39 GHVS01048265.1:332-835(+)